MLDFLKIFGEGLLFFLGLPFILVGLVLYGLYLLFVFIFMSIKGIILFFKGVYFPDILVLFNIISRKIFFNFRGRFKSWRNSKEWFK